MVTGPRPQRLSLAPVAASVPSPPQKTQRDATGASEAYQVAVPVRHVLVRNTRGHVEHDDSALPLDAAGGVGRSQAGELCVSRG